MASPVKPDPQAEEISMRVVYIAILIGVVFTLVFMSLFYFSAH